MARLILIFSLIFLLACKSKQPLVTSKDTVTKDSVHVTELVNTRTVTVIAPVDSVAIKAMVICPDGSFVNVAPFISKSKQALATFKITKGQAEINCKCDTLAITAQVQDKIITQYKSHFNGITTTLVKEVEVIPLWLKIGCVVPWLVLAGLLITNILFKNTI
jgi:hypothetical protein